MAIDEFLHATIEVRPFTMKAKRLPDTGYRSNNHPDTGTRQ
jgi:hypothetical protein